MRLSFAFSLIALLTHLAYSFSSPSSSIGFTTVKLGWRPRTIGNESSGRSLNTMPRGGAFGTKSTNLKQAGTPYSTDSKYPVTGAAAFL